MVLVLKNPLTSARDVRDMGLISGLRRRIWQPTPVLLPGESRGKRMLAGCSQ